MRSERVEVSPGTAALCRRLRVALEDLGLRGVVEVLGEAESVSIRAVSARQADILVRRVEDLGSGSGHAASSPAPGPEQLQLW